MTEVATVGPKGPVRVLVLLVHGRGQVPDDMQRMVAAHVDVAGLRWIMPVAAGKSWYKAKAVDPLTAQTRAQMAAGLAALDAVMAAERAAHPGVPVVAAGFSQGACMVTEWVLRGARVDALAVFTGCRVGAFETGEPARALGGLPVYATCGDQDSWIPLPAFLGMCGTFAAAGARLRADVMPGRPHDICPAEVAEMSRMIAALAEGRPVMADGIA